MSGNEPWERRPQERRRVVVIGAGVAGMTAAHELVERGYEVEVVEAERDPYSPEDAPRPVVGGMARTSWATVLPPTAEFPYESTPATQSGAPPFKRLCPDRVPAPIVFRYDDLFDDPPTKVVVDQVEAFFSQVARAQGALDLQPRPTLHVTAALIGPSTKEQLDKVTTFVRTNDSAATVTSVGPPRSTGLGAPPTPTPELEIQLRVESERVPGEHGFRFFPSFYRHMFDSMKRIPIEEAAGVAGPEPGVMMTSDSARTAFDNLKSADDMELGLNRRHRHDRSFTISRHPIRSVQAIRELLQNTLERAGYRGQDLYRLATRYLEYLTSSAVRRRHEYESISWAQFLGLDRGYSEYFKGHVTSGAQALVAMASDTNDARTIGSVALQLTLDELRVNESGYSDATLRDPTSLALFGPWQAYLESQGVAFTWGRLVGFTGDKATGVTRPLIETKDIIIAPADYYVIAIPIDKFQSLFDEDGSSTASLPGAAPLDRADLIEANQVCLAADAEFLDQEGVPSGERDDLSKQLGYLPYPIEQYEANPDAGPLRYMCGIQFYFGADIRLFLGHSIGLDTPWGVSYLSQEQYWHDRSRGQSSVRGVLSVIFTRFTVEGVDLQGKNPRKAKDCTPDEIAERVWKQIRDTWNEQNGELPTPNHYFLDENLHREEMGWGNRSPYLVNKLGDWEKRGGARLGDSAYYYPVQLGHTVFAGAFMRTATRLNTMEAANESGRRAVNAILRHDHANCMPARVFDLEQFEVPELRPVRELDARVHRRGGRHMLRSRGVEALLRVVPWDLVRVGLPTGGETR